jgi:hypothetical protein
MTQPLVAAFLREAGVTCKNHNNLGAEIDEAEGGRV